LSKPQKSEKGFAKAAFSLDENALFLQNGLVFWMSFLQVAVVE
jgi:hypothetical protein